MTPPASDLWQGAVAACLIAVSVALVLWISRMIGRWIVRALSRTFADEVEKIMAPDLARLGTRLGGAVDEMRESNAAEHATVWRELRSMKHQQQEIVDRLKGLEAIAGGGRRHGDRQPEPEG